MHPHDANPRGIAQGDQVRVVSEEGEMEIEVNLTEDILPGVLCLLQGAWTHRDENGVEKGGAANILTSTTPTFPSQGSRTHSIFVEAARQ
jgi:anaerobic selenocysteine-containing dehydrogenase